MDWHDQDCRRPDLFTIEGMETCLNCGASRSWGEESAISPSPPASDEYCYEPLSKGEIRLLTISPGEIDDFVQCRISKTLLSDRPDYYAMSYTWADETGNQDHDCSVFLNGYDFPITSNCLAALKRIRKRDTSKPIWVDALCIDQQNDLEKNHQVSIMPQIYAQAVRVLVYVGEPTPDESELLEFLESRKDDVPNRLELETKLPKFFSRRWFSRVWVYQEVILSRAALLICGPFVLPWQFLHTRCLDILKMSANSDTSIYQNQLPSIFQVQKLRDRGPIELFELLDLARPAQASDPRDKIFALLGFTFKAETGGLRADYTKSTHKVYLEVAETIARDYGISALLARSLFVEKEAHINYDELNIPFWVPNWAEKLDRLPHKIDYMLNHVLSEKPFINPLPIQIDPDGRSISFPVCEIVYNTHKTSGPRRRTLLLSTDLLRSWKMKAMDDFANTKVEDRLLAFRWKSRSRSDIREPLPRSGKLLYAYKNWFVETPQVIGASTFELCKAMENPVSIYLLPRAGLNDSIDFSDLEVNLAWDETETKTLRWKSVGDSNNHRSGNFSRHGLAVIHEPEGTTLLYGMIPIIRTAGMLSQGGIGVFKQVTLLSDLSFETEAPKFKDG